MNLYKNISLLIIITCLQISVYGQEYSKFMPFGYNDKYGIVNTETQKESVEPTYKFVNNYGDYEFVTFDYVHAYNLSTGDYVTIPNQNKYSTKILLEHNLYYFYKDKLYNIFKDEIIDLPWKDIYSIRNERYFDTNSKKYSDYIQVIQGENLIITHPTKDFKTKLKVHHQKINFLENNIGIITYADKTLSYHNFDFSKQLNFTEIDFEEINEEKITLNKNAIEKVDKFYHQKTSPYDYSFNFTPAESVSPYFLYAELEKNIPFGENHTLKNINLGYRIYPNAKENEYVEALPLNLKVKKQNNYNLQHYTIFLENKENKAVLFIHNPKINAKKIAYPANLIEKFIPQTSRKKLDNWYQFENRNLNGYMNYQVKENESSFDIIVNFKAQTKDKKFFFYQYEMKTKKDKFLTPISFQIINSNDNLTDSLSLYKLSGTVEKTTHNQLKWYYSNKKENTIMTPSKSLEFMTIPLCINRLENFSLGKILDFNLIDIENHIINKEIHSLHYIEKKSDLKVIEMKTMESDDYQRIVSKYWLDDKNNIVEFEIDRTKKYKLIPFSEVNQTFILQAEKKFKELKKTNNIK